MSEFNEPWRVGDGEIPFTSGTQIIDSAGAAIVSADCDSPHDVVDQEIAQRIVACVNFCAGTPTADLIRCEDFAAISYKAVRLANDDGVSIDGMQRNELLALREQINTRLYDLEREPTG